MRQGVFGGGFDTRQYPKLLFLPLERGVDEAYQGHTRAFRRSTITSEQTAPQDIIPIHHIVITKVSWSTQTNEVLFYIPIGEF
jgi:hypothetical protein